MTAAPGESSPTPVPARDRGARMIRDALDGERIRFRPWGHAVHASIDGGPEFLVGDVGSRSLRRGRRYMRALYESVEGHQPNGEALRVMLDTLTTAAEAARAAHPGPEPEPASEVGTAPPHDDAEDGAPAVFVREGGEKKSQADHVIALVERDEAEFFRTPGDDLYVRLVVRGRIEIWLIGSRDFRRYIRRRYYEEYEKAVRSEAVSDALGVFEGRALVGPERDVHTRVAPHRGALYVDLGDRQRRIVKITARGWKIVRRTSVCFRRPAGMLPLPIPQRGGSVDELRRLLNVPDEDGWTLLIGFLIGAFHPLGPYIVLVLIGERGTAKSTATRLAIMLVDPKDAPLRRPPKDERDLAIAARHGRLIAFNNLSRLSGDLSDAVSALATEGGFTTRLLYSNDEEARFRDRRPIILNGIPDFVTRGDLADRSVKVTLHPIAPDQRREESVLLAEFERVRPRVLGALFDALAHALATVAQVVLPTLPRMADAVKWITAAEPALGWEPGRFLAALDRATSEAATNVVEADVVALAVRRFASTTPWRGSAGDLLRALERQDPDVTKSKFWPRTPQGMAGGLRRCAPDLRSIGVILAQDPVEDRARRTRLWNLHLATADGPTGSPATNPTEFDFGSADADTLCPDCGVLASDGHECDPGVVS